MARIFQKYVTPEGRTETPPEVVKTALKSFKSEEEVKNGSGAISIGDIGIEGEREEESMEIGVDSAISMYILMKGIRNMMQYMMKMTKGMNFG